MTKEQILEMQNAAIKIGEKLVGHPILMGIGLPAKMPDSESGEAGAAPASPTNEKLLARGPGG